MVEASSTKQETDDFLGAGVFWPPHSKTSSHFSCAGTKKTTLLLEVTFARGVLRFDFSDAQIDHEVTTIRRTTENNGNNSEIILYSLPFVMPAFYAKYINTVVTKLIGINNM